MTKYRPKVNGTVWITCWCESETVFVPQEDFDKGLTLPCYQQHCKDIDELKRKEL